MRLGIVICGLSITSSWGNGHATTYRGLVRELARRGHEVTFLERDQEWYARNRDLPDPPYGRTHLYGSVDELRDRFAGLVRDADLVIVGSYVPDGIAVGEWVCATARGTTAFYDIDTPITVASLATGDCAYLSRALVPRYDLYLSFTGGPMLRRIERGFGARRAAALYCAVDPELHYPEPAEKRWKLGYLGTYSADRQPGLEALLLGPARARPRDAFVVGGPQYPAEVAWPANVARIDHVAPDAHRAFYSAQCFTLNITRRAMTAAGWSPSVRLFEAAACGVPIVSDRWDGIEQFFTPGEDILLARDTRGDGGHTGRRRAGAARRDRGVCPPARAGRTHGSEPRRRARGAGARPRPRAGVGPVARHQDGPAPRDPVAALGPWFQNLHLPDGRETRPDHPFGDFPAWKWREIAPHLPADLAGWRALEIGCNAGFYGFELARRGAEVTGIDCDAHYLRQARWAARQFGLAGQVRFQRRQIHSLARAQARYDLVFFMGVAYHLRYPMLALDTVARLRPRLMVFQTMTVPGEPAGAPAAPEQLDFQTRNAMAQPGWPRLSFVEGDFAGDPTVWWAANDAAVEAMLRAAGFRVVARPGHEIYVCGPAETVHDFGRAEEWSAATGRRWNAAGR